MSTWMSSACICAHRTAHFYSDKVYRRQLLISNDKVDRTSSGIALAKSLLIDDYEFSKKVYRDLVKQTAIFEMISTANFPRILLLSSDYLFSEGQGSKQHKEHIQRLGGK